MSDTHIGRYMIAAREKAMLMFAIKSIALTTGSSMLSMGQEQWDSMWWMQQSAFWLMQIGNVGNTMHAFYDKQAAETVIPGKGLRYD